MVIIERKFFGQTKDKKEVYNYILKGSIEVILSSYGATVVSLKVPDRNGKLTDVVLGYDDIKSYESNSKYLGATVGRCCNRIGKGKIYLSGKEFSLSLNDGNNHLHGGFNGLNSKVWDAEVIENGVKFTCQSPSGEDGYPGNLNVSVEYTVQGKSLCINYTANADNETVCNLTNHTYFNLKGKGDILDVEAKINADNFTENDIESLPTGKIVAVENTPLDFRQFKAIGKNINDDYYQLNYAKGFDQNWVVNDFDGKVKEVAEAYDNLSGIHLKVLSNYPGVQFYSGNFLDGSTMGKNGMEIKNHSGFCFECQYFPNAFANKNFPQPILKPGEVYNKTIIYEF